MSELRVEQLRETKRIRSTKIYYLAGLILHGWFGDVAEDLVLELAEEFAFTEVRNLLSDEVPQVGVDFRVRVIASVHHPLHR